jgi:hypothetical protein
VLMCRYVSSAHKCNLANNNGGGGGGAKFTMGMGNFILQRRQI